MPTYSENGKNSYTAAAAVAKGDVLKFAGDVDAQGLPSVTPTVASGDVPIAIALTDANQGEKVAVKILGTGGTTLVKARGVVDAGMQLNSLCSGFAQPGHPCIGIALGSANAGELVEVATVSAVIQAQQGS